MKRIITFILFALLLLPLEGQIGRYPFYSASERTYATVLNDGNTIGWFIASETGDITKDATDSVSIWKDHLGGSMSLRCTDNTKAQPIWSSDGILFNGVEGENNLQMYDGVDYDLPAISQPIFMYLVLKQVTWTADDYIFRTGDGNYLKQRTTTPRLRAYFSAVMDNDSLAINTTGIIRILLNGESSKFQIDDTPAVNVSQTGAWNDFSLGAYATVPTTYNSNILVKELIFRKVDDTGVDETLIYNYLDAKY